MGEPNYAEFKEKLEIVQENIVRAARSSNRNPQSIKLMIVTKRRDLQTVRMVLSNGMEILGENYPEKAVEKIKALQPEFPEAQWHMIGHIQSRKLSLISKYFTMVHSLDRLKTAIKLSMKAKYVGRKIPVLLQFNVSGEKSKWGWPAWDEKQWADLFNDLDLISMLEGLEVSGVMTMPPLCAAQEDSRPYFVRLRKLQSFLQHHYENLNLKECSMGTSGDYQVAVQEGATFIRLGEAVLGKRI